jgi:protein-tyrosine phosphatase
MEGQKSGCISPASYDFIIPLRMRILMICLGNICRSPLADGLLRNKVSEKKLPWFVDSAGTAAYHIGNPPDHRMIQTAKENGIDISGLRARQFTSQDYEDFDRIYVMDQSNYKNVLALANSNADRQKVYLLLDHLYPNKQLEVPDPYYGNQSDFDAVFTLVNEATEALISDLTNDK